MDLEVSSNKINNSPWDKLPPVNIQISKLDKESTVRNHLNTLKGLFSMEKRWKNAIFYPDGSKSDQNLGAGLCYMFGDNVKEFSWNLGTFMEVYDAELLSILKALRLSLKESCSERIQDVWIFSENQAAIQQIQSIKTEPEQHLTMKCQQILQSLQDYDVTPHIH